MSGIYEKLRRVLKGRALGMLDSLERPDQSLRVTVDELEETARKAKEAAASYGAVLRKSEKELEQCKRLRAEWERRAEISVGRGDEGAAREALREKIRLDGRIADLTPRVEVATATYRALKEEVRTLQQRLDEARLRQATLETRRQAALAQRDFARHLGRGGSGAQEGAFGAMEEHVFEVEAEAEIEREIAGEVGDRGAELESRSIEGQVESELDDLRRRVGGA